MHREPCLQFLLAWALVFPATSWDTMASESVTPVPLPLRDVSLKHEVEHALDRGLVWLQGSQHSNGWWSTPDHPAVTSLALMAFQGAPGQRYGPREPAWLKRGYEYLASCIRPDGGIHRGQLVSYNTALGMMALLAANNPDYEPALRKARRFLVGLQKDFGQQGRLDSPFDGGVGYGSSHEHSDMSNTLLALEALHYSRHLRNDQGPSADPDLNWAAAIHFLQHCQNLPSHNPEPWASDDPAHKGGFVYFPGESKAGQATNAATGRVALRSYGSISYAGLLSYIYAQLKPDDPRVQAVYDWLRKNYTLAENPGMGAQGLYYYFHTMTKALTAYGVKELTLADGRGIDWRKELALRLVHLQKKDGSWSNENNRWWESDPVLVTSYVTLSLEMILRSL
ncbi:MAG: terpene cyclase/mutase family protein [Verrucomicrobia bacterium]|nr:terpene cyclase/mutase family protein [Verrucomicrobiota bacterium]